MGRQTILNQKIIKGFVKDLKEGCTFEQACLLNAVSTQAGYLWRSKGIEARELLNQDLSEGEKLELLALKGIYVEFVEAIEKAKVRSCIERDKLIKEWGEKRNDWRAAAHLNRIYDPATYGEQEIINRAVEQKFSDLMNTLFFLLSPQAYKEVKEVAKTLDNNYQLQFQQMDELKAVQVLIESEWLHSDISSAIGGEYLKLRDCIRSLLYQKGEH